MRVLRSPRARWVLLGAAVLLAVCYIATHYRAWLYRGGRLIDHGIFSQPRFEAVFAEIPLDRPGTYSYTFSRFPAAEAWVSLLTPDRPSPEALQSLTTKVRLRVVGTDGTTYCDGIGSPRALVTEGLKIASSDAVDSLWHTSCDRLRLRTCRPCRLDISIGPVDAATPNVRLVVTLAGGGIGLP
jgi:hypothetical protein